MKKAYIRPIIAYGKEPDCLIPAVIGAGMALAAALGAASSSAAALGGLAVGAASTAALGGAVAAGTALSKKGRHHFDSWERLPALDVVEAYS
ncbi:MAG: hypothetical protein LBU25_06035 [Treponema sp.]|jgi:hypothetical protein|nr:hypothetical protein [Treponema sp.]